jgi:hypothetical protein
MDLHGYEAPIVRRLGIGHTSLSIGSRTLQNSRKSISEDHHREHHPYKAFAI